MSLESQRPFDLLTLDFVIIFIYLCAYSLALFTVYICYRTHTLCTEKMEREIKILGLFVRHIWKCCRDAATSIVYNNNCSIKIYVITQ